MLKPPKVLFCDPSYSANTNRIPSVLRIKYWQKQGLSVSILCSTEAREFYASRLQDVKYYTFPFRWRSKEYYTAVLDFILVNLKAFPLIFKVKDEIDIVYSLSSVLDIIIFPYLLKLLNNKIRWYVNVDNTVPKPSERPGSYLLKIIPYLAFLISNILLKRTDGIFVVVNFLKTYYEKKGIKVIKTADSYGVDTEIFTGAIPASIPIFDALFAARLHPAKGIYDLVEIIKLVTARKKDFTLGIMGDGVSYHKEKLQKNINLAGLNKNIILLGYLEGKKRGDILRNCRLFLFPSYAEGMTIAVLEALAVNKPVISYDLPEYRDVFGKYLQTGQLVIKPKGDYKAIARFILEGKYLSGHFSNKLSDYSWERIFTNEALEFLTKNQKKG